MERIGDYACINYTQLDSVIIGSSVSSIGNDAFYGCSGLTSVTIPESVSSIDAGAFFGCSSLTRVIINSASIASSGKYNEEYTLANIFGSQVKEYDFYAAGRIGAYACYNCTQLTSVHIGAYITSIDTSAFQGCSGLTYVDSSTGISGKQLTIGNYAFKECSSLTNDGIGRTLNIDRSVSIKNGAFFGCNGLRSVTIGFSVFSIDVGAFQECNRLTSVIINSKRVASKVYNKESTLANIFGSQVKKYEFGSAVERIGSYACYNCTQLTTVIIGSGVSIGDHAFQGCSGLTQVAEEYNVFYVGLSSIGDYAFQGCSSLHHIYIPKYVNSISTSAFLGCTNINDVQINSPSIASSDKYNENFTLANIFGPQVRRYSFKNTEGIGAYACYNCTQLTTVIIDGDVTSINTSAFYGCSSLAYVSIPESVTDIGEGAFNDCNSLNHVKINSASIASSEKYNGGYTLANIFGPQVTNYEFGNEGAIGAYVCYNCTQLNSVTIGDGVTSIENNAFYGCNGLTDITIGGSVTTIEDNAFSGCGGLIKVTIYGSNLVANNNYSSKFSLANIFGSQVVRYLFSGAERIGAYAFYNCTQLESVFLGREATSIGSSAFEGCISLASVTIPNSVKAIGESAFKDCRSLTSVTIPNSVKAIGESAFKDCRSLTSVTIPNSVTLINHMVFSGCSSLSSITIPGTVTKIGEGAFNGCSSLNSVTIPESVTSIGYSAFSDCSSLTRFNIPKSVTKIESFTFQRCSGLISVTIPEGVTSIGYGAFIGCNHLTSVTIPEAVTSIDENAFQNCSGLKRVIVKIKTPLSIHYSTFEGCENATLYVPIGCKAAYMAASYWKKFKEIAEFDDSMDDSNTIQFADTNVKAICVAKWDFNEDGELSEKEAAAVTDLGSFFRKNASITSFDELQYFTRLTSIGESAFSGCSSLTSITIPESVTSIGKSAFSGCKVLASVNIPESVTSIEESAFSGCSSLISVNIPNNVTSIGNYVFYYCSGLTSVNIPDNVTSIGNSAFYYCSGLTSVNIPSSVTSIGNSAFSGCSGLASITIPENVTDIGEYAFSSCSGLTSITIPESVTSISNGTFSGCKALTSAIIPESVTSIGKNAFSSCNSLSSISIPGNVSSIGEYAFSLCDALTSVTIPSSVTSIGNRAFSGSLETIVVAEGNARYDSRDNSNAIIETTTNTLLFGCMNTIIPESVTSIGDYAFNGCSSLTSIDIPESVTSIGIWAFASCENLVSIAIPEGVTSIKKYTFNDCNSLASVTIPKSVTSIGDYVFGYCESLRDFYCYAEQVPNLGSSPFEWSGIGYCTLHVPAASLDAYRQTRPWSNFGNIVVIDDNGGDDDTIIDFADANVKAICVANWDTNGSGELSEEEAAAVTDLGGAFNGNAEITSFDELQYFTGLASIGNTAFYGCNNLTSIIIPNSVTSIGNQAFNYCGLTSINIPESVVTIGAWAFGHCVNLTAVTIPENVTRIDYGVFSGCNSLTSIIVEEGNGRYDSRDNCNAIIETTTNTLIAGCMNTVISESVMSIGEWAFDGNNLSSIVIPKSVTSIADGAFYSCYNLTSITILANDISIGELAFDWCNSLTDVWCYGEQIPNTESNVFGDSNIGSATLHVPAVSLDAYRQTEPWCNFGNIVAINDNGGDDDTIIYFADANVKAVCVANWDTNGDGELSEEEAAAVTDLGGAFYGNAEITSFDELQYFTGLTSIGTSAFNNCTNLASVGLPNTLTSIEGYAFYCCQSLTSVVIPESVTWIGESAFQNCYNLTSANLPSGITTITSHLFCGCKLNSITIPSGVTSIGELAFYSDSRADDVWCYAENIPSTGDEIFNNWLIRSSTLHVPAASLDAYRQAEPWCNFGNIVTIGYIENRQIYDISELSNNKQYIIRTKDEARGSLGVANGELASTNPVAQGHKCEEATPFAILQYDGNYYLYSTADRKFITNKGGETDVPGQIGRHAVTVTKNTNGYFMFNFTNTGYFINVNTNPGIDINYWGQEEDKWDDGNQFTIAEVGDFNPTEALAMFDDAQYMAALQSIETGTQYTIYTDYNGTRYYLTNTGYLTEEPDDNCIFTFYCIWSNDLYRSPGWKFDACFSNPKLSNGATGELLPQGHILTDKDNNRIDWEGQVWYLGENGCYAVRATNANSDEWGAQTYWTVLDTDGNGLPEADYSWTPNFVWQIEHDQDFIDGISPLLTSPEEEGQVYKQSSTIVNLAGQRMNKLQQGINIRQKNGRTQKILMK